MLSLSKTIKSLLARTSMFGLAKDVTTHAYLSMDEDGTKFENHNICYTGNASDDEDEINSVLANKTDAGNLFYDLKNNLSYSKTNSTWKKEGTIDESIQAGKLYHNVFLFSSFNKRLFFIRSGTDYTDVTPS